MDPKSSQIDIIQAVGRAIRKSYTKKIGTIFIPVFIDEEDDVDTILSSSAFKPVWSVDVNHYQKIVPSNPPEPLHAPQLHNSTQIR